MKLKRRRIKRGRIEIIPMIDTIVILLIFYMTFSRLAEASRSASITLPDAKAGGELHQKESQLIVNMMSAEEVTVDGEDYKIENLADVLRQAREAKLKRGMTNQLSVILRGDKSMTYKDLSKFMIACGKANVIDVSFAVVKEAKK